MEGIFKVLDIQIPLFGALNKGKTKLYLFIIFSIQTACTQIRRNKMWGLAWIQTILTLTDGLPERIFLKT